MSGASVEVPENSVHCQVKSECRDGQLDGSEGPERCSSPPCADTSLLHP